MLTSWYLVATFIIAQKVKCIEFIGSIEIYNNSLVHCLSLPSFMVTYLLGFFQPCISLNTWNCHTFLSCFVCAVDFLFLFCFSGRRIKVFLELL